MVYPTIPHDLDITVVLPLPSQPGPDLPVLADPQRPDLSADHPEIRSRPLPGVRCPTCAQAGKESWVIPGRACSTCGTPCF